MNYSNLILIQFKQTYNDKWLKNTNVLMLSKQLKFSFYLLELIEQLLKSDFLILLP